MDAESRRNHCCCAYSWWWWLDLPLEESCSETPMHGTRRDGVFVLRERLILILNMVTEGDV